MEARCYRGGEGRTKLNETRFEKRDVVAALLLIIFLVMLVASRFI